jgi:type VI secretion system secreted protein VgrG
MVYTQDNRPIKIDTPLGENALLVTGLSGVEAISMPFRFELELISEDHNIAFGATSGTTVNK